MLFRNGTVPEDDAVGVWALGAFSGTGVYSAVGSGVGCDTGAQERSSSPTMPESAEV